MGVIFRAKMWQFWLLFFVCFVQEYTTKIDYLWFVSWTKTALWKKRNLNQKRGFPFFKSGGGGLWSELQLRLVVQETSLSIIFKKKEVRERNSQSAATRAQQMQDYRDEFSHTDSSHPSFTVFSHLEIFCLSPEEFGVNTLLKQATWQAWSPSNLISSHIPWHKSIGLSGWNRREADE